MLNEVEAFVRANGLLEPGETVVCAVSGGADSMALLWAMFLLAPKWNLKVSAAHFNHNLRGAESRRDEDFVREFCGRFDIPLTVGEGRVIPEGKGLEAAARDARYAFLESLSGKIATAHTAGDNAETVLMRLVRGTGLRGLGGIAPRRGRLIRPMLTVTRGQVLAFLEEYRIPHVEDSTNGEDDFLRNRLRHYVMPLLEGENPKIAENLSAMALNLRQDNDVLEELSKMESPLSVPRLREMRPALRKRALARFLQDCGAGDLEMSHIALAERLVFSENPSARGEFPGGVLIRRNYDFLEAGGNSIKLMARSLPCPGSLWVPELGATVTCRPAETVEQGRNVFTVCPSGTITLRSREAGDAIRTCAGTRPLKKLFIDRKIPAHLRQAIPVFADNRGVLAVGGIGPNPDRAASEMPAVRIQLEYPPAETGRNTHGIWEE